MQKRYNRGPVNEIFNSGKFGKLVSLGHKLLYPNETIRSHKVNARVLTCPVDSAISGAYVDVFSFLVPIRLIWPDFVDYCLDPDSGVTPGTAAQDYPELLVKSGEIDWPVLAHDLIYETFFERDVGIDSNQYLPNPTLSMWDQTLPQGTGNDVEIPVDVTNQHVNLADIDHARYDLRQREWLENVNHSYNAMLQSMGVDTSDMQMVPEIVGTSRKWVYPTRDVDESTGLSVQSYVTDVSFKRDRKRMFVAEHSLLIDFVAVRPKLYDTAVSTWLDQLNYRNLYVGPLPPSETEELDFRAFIWSGERLAGKNSLAGTQNGAYSYAPANTLRRLYPKWEDIITTTGISTDNDHFMVDSRTNTQIATWIKPPHLVKAAPTMET